MADLDNFFARKDKKKKGKGKKFPVTSGTSMAKTLEQQGPGTSSDNQETTRVEQISIPTIPAKEDEWREDEQKEEDLEGLKVQALKLEEQDERTEKYTKESSSTVEGEDYEDESEMQKGSSASPWQNVPSQPTEAVVEQQPPPLSEKLGTYVPPSLRKATGLHRRSNAPPDIQSDRNFPSLQSSVQTEKKEDRFKNKDFTEVKAGKSAGRSADAQYQAPGLELTNKYTTLETS